MFCTNCGKEINDQADFCIHCGCATKKETAAAPMIDTNVSEGKGASIAALVLGLIGVLFSWFGWFCYIALACAIAGIIFGAVGMKKSAQAHNGRSSGLAIAGLVLGIIGTVFALIAVVVCTCILGAAAAVNEAYEEAYDYYYYWNY